MLSEMKEAGGFFAALVVAMLPAQASDAASCESLKKLKLPHTTITMAEVTPAGLFYAPPGGPPAQGPGLYANLPAFCRVAATIAPSSDSDIKIEVWLPAARWNGKFQA